MDCANSVLGISMRFSILKFRGISASLKLLYTQERSSFLPEKIEALISIRGLITGYISLIHIVSSAEPQHSRITLIELQKDHCEFILMY